MPRAASLAASIRSEIGTDSELVAGDSGVFDVAVGGELVFSKHAEGRFPTEAEIIQKLRPLA